MSDVLADPRLQAFCAASGRLQPATLDSLREAEAAALARKQKHFQNTAKLWDTLATREPGVDPLCRSLGDFADRLHWKVALNVAGAALRAVTAVSRWRGGARGCDESTPLHASVAKALAEERDAAVSPP